MALLAIGLIKCWAAPFDINIENINIGITFQYVALLITGFAIWYGYNTYDKTANILKPKENYDEKLNNFASAKSFQLNLTYIAGLIDVVLFAIFKNELFGIACFCCLIIMAINFPTESRFENDFFETKFLDEELNESENEEEK